MNLIPGRQEESAGLPDAGLGSTALFSFGGLTGVFLVGPTYGTSCGMKKYITLGIACVHFVLVHWFGFFVVLLWISGSGGIPQNLNWRTRFDV